MHGGFFHGVSHGQADEEVFGDIFNQHVIRRLLPYVLPYKHMVALGVAAMLVYSGTQVAVPWIIKIGVDDYITRGDLSGLGWVMAMFAGNALLNWGSGYLQQIAMEKVGQGVLYDLRGDMFAHLQRQSVGFYDKTEAGRLISRVQGDVWQLQEFTTIIVMTLGDMLSLVGVIAALLLMDLNLGLITMTVLPVLILVMMVWQPYARRAFMRVRLAVSIVNASLNENIAGVRVVQSMNRQDRNMEVFDGKNREHLDANLVASRMGAGLLPPVDILTGAAIGLVIYFGSGMVSDDALGVGALIAFVMYIQRFFDPIRDMTMQYSQLQRSMASGTRIFDLLDASPEVVDAPGARDLPRLRGEIEYRDLSFSYALGDDVLKNVNLHVAPGETVAIVGPTGAGKTTLVSLLARFYEVPRGRGAVLVDGHDIRDVTRRSLAKQMGMVLQEPFLFSGTVRDNIKYNHVRTSDERMIEVARAVGADEFIMRLEDGYDTHLGERGGNISPGQRQLISLARAIVADPRILILDEATANIDSHSEILIQRALQQLLKGRTSIVIAHRLSTVRGADKIVALHHGEIVETGTHRELLARDGLYAHLYRMSLASLEQMASAAGDGRRT